MRLLALLAALAIAVSVAAPSSAQEARSLDDLWREATLWEVGSNAEKVPAARQALIARGDEALAFLIPAKLDTKDTLVTRALSVVVTGIRGGAAERLRAALSHESPNVRRNAADLLGQLGDRASAAAIAALLQDPDTRGGALAALGSLKARESAEAVAAILNGGAGIKERESVSAASNLGAIGGSAAETALVAALSDERAQVRHAAQLALERLANPSALVATAASRSNGHARLHAIAALGRIGDGMAAGALQSYLHDSSPIVRGFAAEALGALRHGGDPVACEEALARETDPFARGKLEACRDALRGRAERARHPDVLRLASWLEGSFGSAAQAARDPAFRDVRLHVARIWRDRDDGPWLYVEQAMADALDAPYRQRIYQLIRRSDGALESRVFTLPSPEAAVGAWKDAGRLAGLSPSSLTERAGCEITLRFADDAFEGATRERACPSDLRGASWASSEVTLRADRLLSWDRGFDADGKQVWGAETGGYEFLRDSR